MSAARVIRRVNSVSRLGRLKLRKRLARDRWGSILLDTRLRHRRNALVNRINAAARAVINAHRPSSTGMKGLGLGGAVALAVVLIIGAKTWWPGNGPPTPAGAIAAMSKPAVTRPIAPPQAPIPQKQEPVATLASSAQPPSAPPVVHGELTQLKLNYEAARERCLTRLYTSPEYMSAKSKADELENQVRHLRGNDPNCQLILVSPKWIEAKSNLSRLAQAALEGDPDVQATANALRARGLMK